MKIFLPEQIHEVVALLKNLEVVALPTETVYGLAGNAFSDTACAKIFSAKERPYFDPLIVHTQTLKTENAAKELTARKLIQEDSLTLTAKKTLQLCADHFWPGPLTLILPKHPKLSDLVSSGLPTVGIRIPLHPLFQKILEQTGFPLAAPSANRFGRISPVNAAQVVTELDNRIHGVLEGGTSNVGVESTILKILNDGRVEVLRPGGTSLEKIRQVLGVENVLHGSGTKPVITAETPATAPGTLESHYAPLQTLYRLPTRLEELLKNESNSLILAIQKLSVGKSICALLSPDRDLKPLESKLASIIKIPVCVFSLSKTGCNIEAAASLFTTLRQMDNLSNALLLVEPIQSPNELYWAIKDRLERASSFLESQPGVDPSMLG